MKLDIFLTIFFDINVIAFQSFSMIVYFFKLCSTRNINLIFINKNVFLNIYNCTIILLIRCQCKRIGWIVKKHV